ncbi:DUF4430 domain-containing protein [Prolixibacteraceae bacterium Z1-6]|uniref:DUF4430 domain-containing protein n=1 Tax=Draconibacterium aestuarii TaxID=2998507 RepID=A0A9X3F753_9BACT|nr:DUF4430 domain-containing protein [Prolixibacteraceae bacterium Z1-6]
MQKLNSKSVLLFVFLLAFVAFNAEAKEPQKVTVEIKYDENNSSLLKIETDWREGLSALEALQFVAKVNTHPVGSYVFVSAINNVEGVPNKSVWYYTVNGEPAKKIAINQPLKKGDVVTWIYKQDVCSAKK